MPNRQEFVVKRLQAEGAKTAAFFRTLTEANFSQQVYTTGPTWRVRDLLAHFVSAENTFREYGLQILAGGSGAPEDFIIDEFNAIQVAALRDASTADLITQFEAARAATIGMMQGMQDSDFDRVGRHPWFGRVPLENMSKLIYRHTMLHERDIRRAIDSGQPVPHQDVQPPAAA